MGITDIILMVAIVAGSGWMLYRSLFKKKGTCAGCTSCAGGKNKTDNKQSSKRGDSLVRLALAVLAVCGFLLTSSTSHAGHPLVTDDAGTVGQGKGQMEIGSQIWHHKDDVDAAASHRAEGGEIAPIMTIGLHDRVDLVVAVPYQWQALETNGMQVSRADGLADAALDVKWRFFDGNGWGVALKPGIVLPTGDKDRGLGSGRTAYRLFFITSKEIGSFACHMNLGYMQSENNADKHRDIWYASMAGEYEVVKNLKVVANIGTARNPASGSSINPAFALGGLAYALSERITVDGGVKFGLNKAETDFTYLFGITVKF